MQTNETTTTASKNSHTPVVSMPTRGLEHVVHLRTMDLADATDDDATSRNALDRDLPEGVGRCITARNGRC